jgi:hypothetical protein
MKSMINQPMKSIFLRSVLCGIVSLSTAANWNAARGIVVEEGPHKGGRSAPPRRAPQKPVAKEEEHPKGIAKRERRERNNPKVAPHEAPRTEAPKTEAARGEVARAEAVRAEAARAEAGKIHGMRRAIPLRDLERVARLRRELFSHRWSYVYAAGLKHAPKSIRFFQNGTVETELKGERWYWEALDGRRVSLRTLADASQPGIVLEFNEGYTGYQYALPNQTVAVQGAPLEAIAEGPDASTSAGSEPTSLEQALVDYPWTWNDATGKPEAVVRFDKNKSFHVGDRTSFWNVTGPRTVHVEFGDGAQTDLLFDTNLSIYTDGDQISGSRETSNSDTVPASEKSTDLQGSTQSSPPAGVTHATDESPRTLEEALTAYEWKWGKGRKITIFHPNGEMTGLVNKTQWKVTGPRTIQMTRVGRTFEVTFDEAFSEYNSPEATGHRGRRLAD